MTSFIDLLISFGVLTILMVAFLYVPPIKIVFLPLFILLAFIIALGAGLILATMNVKYRDVRFVVPFILQFGMYISPVGYTSEVIPEGLRFLYSMNPMVGVIEGFRWCIIPTTELYLPG
ncbi:ABC transporter permease [Metabacillus endolithicus]|nr:ABC transporter permease [Metabacillus endolithicus]UPG65835.1 ABC transporter permease [Metabacillus endolithicus]